MPVGFFGSKVGVFEGISIYESTWFGIGYNSGGLCLPGFGIFVGEGTFSKQLDLSVVRHEYGHILQAKQLGLIRFYLLIGIPSVLSAWTNGWGRGHQQFWTEGWANDLASKYFGNDEWSFSRFPAKELSKKIKKWLFMPNQQNRYK